MIKGREDDNIETIRKRFKVFLDSSLPVINYYDAKGKVRKVIDSCVSTMSLWVSCLPHVLKDIILPVLGWCCKACWGGIWVSQSNFRSKKWEGKSLRSLHVKNLHVQVPFSIEEKIWKSKSLLLIWNVFILILQYAVCILNYKVTHALHGFLKKFNLCALLIFLIISCEHINVKYDFFFLLLYHILFALQCIMDRVHSFFFLK